MNAGVGHVAAVTTSAPLPRGRWSARGSASRQGEVLKQYRSVMTRHSTFSRLARTLAAVGALTMIVGACSSDKTTVPLGTSDESVTSSVSSVDRTVAIAEAAAPPNGTSPPRKAPRPLFTGEAAVVEKAFPGQPRRVRPQGRRCCGCSDGRQARFAGGPHHVHGRLPCRPVPDQQHRRHGDTATIDYENAIVGRNLKTDVTTHSHSTRFG